MNPTRISSLESISIKELKEYFNRFPVAIPTETVYGLASIFTNIKTTNLIYKIKNRPKINPLILHISNINMLERLIEFMPLCYKPIMEKYWPGPLSLIFKANGYTKSYIDSDYICIRMPSNEITLSIINKLGEPLFAPSANLSGKISPTTSKHVLEDLNNKIELIIEGGQSIYGLESTIFDYRSMKVLRPGHISEEEIYLLLKEKELLINPINNSIKEIICPGTKFKHYSPEKELILFKTLKELEIYLKELKEIKKISILYYKIINKNILNTLNNKYNNKIIEFNLGENLKEVSYNFYDFLRKADNISNIILCEYIDKKGDGIAIMDRMERAAKK